MHSTRELGAAFRGSLRRIDDLVSRPPGDLEHPLVEEIAAEIWHEMHQWATHVPIVVRAYRAKLDTAYGPTLSLQDAAKARSTGAQASPGQGPAAQTTEILPTTPPSPSRRTS